MNSIKKTLLLVSAIITTLLASGCSTRIADVTYISTKAINTESLAKTVTDNVRVSGEDKASIIVFIPTGVPSVKEAIDRAIENKPCGVALKDATINNEVFIIPLLFAHHGFIVEGKVLEDVNCLKQQRISPLKVN